MQAAEQSLGPDAIIREFQQPLLGYLKRYFGNQAEAEDLLQETWMRMTRGLDGFADHSSIKTRLFAIASRVAADYLRRPMNKVQLVELGEADDVVDPEWEIGDKVIADEMSACVRQIVDSLSDAYRSTLLLHDLQDFSLEQTAEIAGKRPGRDHAGAPRYRRPKFLPSRSASEQDGQNPDRHRPGKTCSS